MQKPDVQRLIDLQQLMAQFSAVDRRVYLPAPLDRVENDVEHTYTLAMAVWFLAGYFPELDRDKLIRLALAHDLHEIHSGDTFVYDDAATLATKKAREAAGTAQLKQEWADFPELGDAIDEYEQRETAEAKFVYALDKIMVITLNMLSGGKAWLEHDVTFEHFEAEKEKKVPVSPDIYAYYQQLHDLLIAQPQLFAPTKNEQRS